MLFLLRDYLAKQNGGHKVITQIAAVETALGNVHLAMALLQVLHPAAVVHRLAPLALVPALVAQWAI